ncbi:MFS transporter [Pseudooceanicola sp. CBS1P-1]|uniref:MFS transporter n=1 Tax=Pseudooceanicola albus TaxID=2692189 RepID=A0A6L7GAM6_9RHOB|nr:MULTISPECIES: MFS transporter [Pseudooceanicola]MBT9384520.1 MFS transporter [Pseudooceanicola endophyticus]MXN21101.1 MFS transporter [Pseudooceanicola albus]
MPLARPLILLTVAIDMMGIGLIFPVMPDLIRSVLGSTLSEAALWGGVIVAAFAAMQFLFSPAIGALSDARGRRMVLVLSQAILVLDYAVLGLAHSIWLLLLARIIGGIASATAATAAAAISDLTAEGDRAAAFGLLAASHGLGFILGPVLGGLLGQIDPRAPFWAAAGIAGLNAALIWAFLPETLPRARRRPFRWASATPLTALRSLSDLPGLGPLMIVFVLYFISLQVYTVVWSYFGMERFGWDTGLVGLSLALYGGGYVLVQALLVRPALRLLGARRTVLWGLASDLCFLLLLSVLRNGPAALILSPVTAIGAVAHPALTAIAAGTAPADRQGALQGVLAALQALSLVVTPVLMTGIFRGFTGPDAPLYLPGAPFAAAALLLLPGIVIFALRSRNFAFPD